MKLNSMLKMTKFQIVTSAEGLTERRKGISDNFSSTKTRHRIATLPKQVEVINS